MAVTDYDSLKSAVQVWAVRSDSVFSAQFDTFLQFAEDRIYNGGAERGDQLYTAPLRSAVMETTATVTLTDGSGTMPADCLDVIKLFPSGGQIGTTFLPPERFAEMDANIASGSAVYHTVEAGQLKILPRLTGDVNLTYYMRHPDITSSNKTGPLILEHGTVYLAATLFEVFTFLQSGELAGAHLARLKGVIAGANRTAESMRHVGPLRIRPRVVIGA